jgi:hypothetical protein
LLSQCLSVELGSLQVEDPFDVFFVAEGQILLQNDIHIFAIDVESPEFVKPN